MIEPTKPFGQLGPRPKEEDFITTDVAYTVSSYTSVPFDKTRRVEHIYIDDVEYEYECEVIVVVTYADARFDEDEYKRAVIVWENKKAQFTDYEERLAEYKAWHAEKTATTLEQERARLRARLAEIDRELG